MRKPIQKKKKDFVLAGEAAVKKRVCIRIVVLSMVVGTIVLAINQIAEKHRGLSLYKDALRECEWVWKNPDVYKEERERNFSDKYDGIYGYACHAEKYGDTLCYCIKDINADNVPELIIGVRTTTTYKINEDNAIEKVDEVMYHIKMLFFYEEGELATYDVDRYIMKLYKGGIIEWNGGVVGLDEYVYDRIEKKTGKLESAGSFEVIWDDTPRYYQGIKERDENQIEITEEEFNRQRNALIEKGEEKLHWKALDGFCDEE